MQWRWPATPVIYTEVQLRWEGCFTIDWDMFWQKKKKRIVTAMQKVPEADGNHCHCPY
jgi:hypothetical protein